MRSQNLTSYHFERLYLWDSNDDYEDYTLQGCDAVQSGRGFTSTVSAAKQSLITEVYDAIVTLLIFQ